MGHMNNVYDIFGFSFDGSSPHSVFTFVFHRTKKIIQVWNDMRSKQCQILYYCLIYFSSFSM